MINNEQNEQQHNQQITSEPIKKSVPKWLIIAVGIVVLGLVAGGVYSLIKSTHEPKENKIIYEIAYPDYPIFIYNETLKETEKVAIGHKVAANKELLILEKDDKLFEYNLSNKAINEISLRKLKNEGDTIEKISRIILDISGDGALIIIKTFDKKSFDEMISADGPVIIEPISYAEYYYDFDTREIKESSIVKISGVDYDGSAWWWDSRKNLIYSHRAGEGIGCGAPVTIYNLKTGEVKTQKGLENETTSRDEAASYCPFFNNDFSQFVLIPKFDRNQESIILIYNTENINEPISSFDLNKTIPQKPDNWYPYSITWSKDNKKIYLGQADNIYEIDLERKISRLVYKNEDDFTDYHAFVVISDDGKYLYTNNITGKEGKLWGDFSSLTKINLETLEKKVLVQDDSNGLRLVGLYK